MKEKSYIVQNIDKGIWKIPAGSNIYLLRLDEPIVIDAGERSKRKEAEFIEHIIDPRMVRKVIFTHLHYDHIGNFDLFPNAEFFASEEEIESFKKDPEGTVLNKEMAEKFQKAELKPVSRINNPKIEIIKTQGHTKGSICIYLREQQILFSGDTIFKEKVLGRTDLPNSLPEEMPKSLMKLINYPFKILCPGHDY
ncbi:MBL fold metallo-hydrolase [Candidatus Woesearchaeota archaeon]|nr:MBL fold metallo-hydrolase [Candidatus Woesearchaeota archaeon]